MCLQMCRGCAMEAGLPMVLHFCVGTMVCWCTPLNTPFPRPGGHPGEGRTVPQDVLRRRDMEAGLVMVHSFRVGDDGLLLHAGE